MDPGDAVLYGDGGMGPGELLRPELIAKVVRPELILLIGEVEAHKALVIGGAADAQVGATPREDVYRMPAIGVPSPLSTVSTKAPPPVSISTVKGT
jgi:hypothetical protein